MMWISPAYYWTTHKLNWTVSIKFREISTTYSYNVFYCHPRIPYVEQRTYKQTFNCLNVIIAVQSTITFRWFGLCRSTDSLSQNHSSTFLHLNCECLLLHVRTCSFSTRFVHTQYHHQLIRPIGYQSHRLVVYWSAVCFNSKLCKIHARPIIPETHHIEWLWK